MKKPQREPTKGKISEKTHGIGAPSPLMVRRRAKELAVTDGRRADEWNEADEEQARRELTGCPPPSTPADEYAEIVATKSWEEVPGTSGRRVEKVPLRDEGETREKLVEEGEAEADHTTRLRDGRDARKENRE